MIVAGEASGDAHAAKLVEALRRRGRKFTFFGSAGPRMREAGVEPVVNADDLAIMGVTEIARALPMFLSTFSRLRNSAKSRRPDAVVLVDFPEFNLKLARSLKKLGLTVVYYISPQLWGWRKYRKRTISKHVDLLMTILPFEKDWYAAHGISNVEYVGNPLASEVKPVSTQAQFRRKHGLDAGAPLIALLPGSRRKELTRILPPMLEAASIITRQMSGAQFVIALAPTRGEAEATLILQEAESKGPGLSRNVRIVGGETFDALNASDVAAVASGTATLETGIIGTPMAIVYKASPLNYKLVRPLIKVDHFGLINLIAGERVVNEYIQDDFTPDALASEMLRLLEPRTNAEVRVRLKDAAEKLGEGGASDRAAELILELIGREK